MYLIVTTDSVYLTNNVIEDNIHMEMNFSE